MQPNSPISYENNNLLSSNGKSALRNTFQIDSINITKKPKHVVIHQPNRLRESVARVTTPGKARSSKVAHHRAHSSIAGTGLFDPSSSFFKASLPCGEYTTQGRAFVAGQDPTFYEEDPRNLTSQRPISTMGVRDTWAKQANSKFQPIDECTRNRRADWDQIQKNHDQEFQTQFIKDTETLQYFDPKLPSPYVMSVERTEEMRHKRIGIACEKPPEEKHKTNLIPVTMWIAAHTRNQIKDTLERRKEQTTIEQAKLKQIEDRSMQLISEHANAMKKKQEDAEAAATRAEEERKAKRQAALEKKLATMTPWQQEAYLKELEAKKAKRANRASSLTSH